jgi:hypothetical protein
VEETVAEQLSDAVALKFTIAPQVPASVFTLMFEGTLIVGSSLSLTVTSKEQVVMLPAASVAVAITVVVPVAKTEFDGIEVETVAEQLSVAVGLKATTAPQLPASVFTVMFEGHVITGNWLSTTVTVNEHVVVLPAASVAVEVTVVVPVLKIEPEAGVVETVAEQLSVAVTLKLTTALQELASVFTVILEGQLMTGDSLSATITSNVHVVTFPEASIAAALTFVVPTGKVEPDAGL